MRTLEVSMGGAGSEIEHLVLTQILVKITKLVVQRVIECSEQAVLEISDKLQEINTLTENQRKNLLSAVENYYVSDEGEDLKRFINEHASKILEAAKTGNMEEVEKLGKDPKYGVARGKAKHLHDKLNELLSSDTSMNDFIGPVLVALQFQDRIRQELNSINKTYQDYFDFAKPILQNTVCSNETKDFWKKVSKNFTNMEVRLQVLKAALGEDYIPEPSDLNDARDKTNDEGFFLL